MSKNTLHGTGALFWLVITLFLSFKNFHGVEIINFLFFIAINIWFVSYFFKGHNFNLKVKIPATATLLLYFFIAYGKSIQIFPVNLLPKSSKLIFISSSLMVS